MGKRVCLLLSGAAQTATSTRQCGTLSAISCHPTPIAHHSPHATCPKPHHIPRPTPYAPSHPTCPPPTHTTYPVPSHAINGRQRLHPARGTALKHNGPVPERDGVSAIGCSAATDLLRRACSRGDLTVHALCTTWCTTIPITYRTPLITRHSPFSSHHVSNHPHPPTHHTTQHATRATGGELT